MRQRAQAPRTAEAGGTAGRSGAAPGERGQALAPPASGIDFLDSADAAPLVIQPKLKVGTEVSLDGYLSAQSVTKAKKTGDTYSHGGATHREMEGQIVTDLLTSDRTFTVDGARIMDATANLDHHVKARKGIVEFAAKKKYGFGAGSKMRMNPELWEKKDGKWVPKPGVDRLDAMRDVNVSPKEYSISCSAATKITAVAGSDNSPMTADKGVKDDDWVPGDWGYIKNNNFTNDPRDKGLEGENVIYSGHSLFWGHYTGTNTYRTFEAWFDEVKGWNGSATLLGVRTRPKRGLV